ncbi:MAG: FtsQ-type POTRA domain-containing protein [Treponema sp.]|jgi:cell division protein FtsQ|nr:FtsQ-type POTRA domain-containing protein [Treponema sp.]
MLGDFIYSHQLENPSYNNAPYNNTPYGSTPYHADNADTPQKAENAARRLLLLVAVFACCGLVWIFCISPVMVPVKASVTTISGLGRQDVLNVAGIGSGSTYVTINAAEAEKLLAGHYLVDSAKVVKRFPDRLSIFLEPRKAVAVAIATINGRLQPVYFDRHGVVFRIGTDGVGEAPQSWLPVVSGVLEEGLQPWLGMRLSHPLFARIGAIADEDPNIWKAVSEIGVVGKGGDLYDLVLYPVRDSIRLRMASDITKDSIYYALLMFDVSRKLGGAVPGEIDVRSGIGVVTAKEARFGE